MHRLESIFGELGISQYLSVFLEQGFDTWDTILDITESDLDVLGVKLGHRRKLQRRIANSRGVAPEASLAPTGSEDPRLQDSQRNDAPRVEVRDSGTVVVLKRKYRRHPKLDENAPERPPSAYVIFSNKMREELKGRNLTFTEIAKLVGENWQSLSMAEKEPYESQAQAIKDKYHRDLAEYKKTPEFRKYNQYLQDFKAKHSLPSQEKDTAKRVKLEPGTSRGGNPAQSRMSRPGSGSGSQRGSEPPTNRQQQMDAGASAHGSPHSTSGTPVSYHASPEASSMQSPVTNTLDRPSTELSPTFSTSTMDSMLPLRRNLNWADDQRQENSRNLPSLSDVFENQRFMVSPHLPAELSGFGFPREHANSPGPGPAPGLVAGDVRPATLRKDQSSDGSTGSSSSSFGHPRTPVEGTLPIQLLLSSNSSNPYESGQPQQSYFQGAPLPLEHKQQPFARQPPNGVSLPIANGTHHGSSIPLPAPIPHHAGPGYGQQNPPPHVQRNLDGMSALLKAGEIVDRRAQ